MGGWPHVGAQAVSHELLLDEERRRREEEWKEGLVL